MGKKKVKEPETPTKENFDPVELVTKKPETLVLMLQSKEESILHVACDALYKFAEKSPENKLQLLSFGGLECLVQLLNHAERTVRINAAMCVGIVASEVLVRRALRKHGSIEFLLNLLSTNEDVTCHEFSTLALSHLAEDFASKAEVLEKNGLSLLINHLSSNDCDVQRNTVRTVGLLLQDYHSRPSFHELKGVAPLLNLLDSEYPVIQALTLEALITCSQDAGCRADICINNGLDKLVTILANKTVSDLHLSTLKCLSFALQDYDSLKFIQSSGVFDTLINLITEPTSVTHEIKQNAMSVIAITASVDCNRRIFNEQNIEASLVTLTQSDNLLTAISATTAVAAMAENLSSRDKFGKLGVVDGLVSLLQNESESARVAGSLVLANLSVNNAANCQLILERRMHTILIECLRKPEEGKNVCPALQSNSALCLANLSNNPKSRMEFGEAGIISALCEALKSTHENVQESCCKALAALLCDSGAKTKFLEEGAMGRLVELVRSRWKEVRRHASVVLVLCAKDKRLAEEITKCGGLEVLLEVNSSSLRSSYTETAFDHVLKNDLPAKYVLTGVLAFDDVIGNTFYDSGRIPKGNNFEALKQLSEKQLNDRRAVLFVNKITRKQQNPQQQQQQQHLHTIVKEKKASAKSPDKNPKTSKKEKEKAHQQDETPVTPTAVETPKKWSPPNDPTLLSYMKETEKLMASFDTVKEQYYELACFVSSKLGGEVKRSEKFSFELHIGELKARLQSNIVPIGMVQRGVYYHRALLFKVLADHLQLPCSLVRGDYNRAWNEIAQPAQDGKIELPPRLYVVDLMHDVGHLMPSGSPQAVTYQRI